GFTLIELVACIVIIAVLAVAAAPRFFETPVYSERGYAGEIAAALRAARQVAVTSSCEVQITLDPVTGYQALQRTALGNSCNPAGAWTVPVRLSDGNVLAGTPPAGVAAAPAALIVFDRTGRASGVPASITVGAFVVTVAADSGFVSGP